MTRRPSTMMVIWLIGLLAVSCASPSSPPPASSSGASTPSDSPTRNTGPKTLRLAVDVSAEPTNGMVLFGRGAAVGAESALMFHSGLTVWDENSNVTPRLAERVPSLQNGDWKVAPDGSMEVTWHLRTDARWHDGTPLTAEDFVFGHTIRADRTFAVPTGPPARLIDSVVATDPRTLVVHWKQPYVFGNISGPEDFPALPRHLMESVYQQGDKDAFLASPLWTSGWVGLGPYRVGNWSLGSQLEAVAFDQYLLGKPKIDRIIIQYYGEPNAAMAALMSGAVDMTPVGSTYVLDQMVNIKRAWDPSKGGTTLAIPRGVRNLKIQFRDPSAPWARDASTRRALAYSTDRQTFVDTLEYGLTTPAYTAVTPDDPVFAQLRQRGFNQYDYDPNTAARLLTDAGWSKGADGVYQRNGQRFHIDVAIQNRASFPQEATALASQWSQFGLDSSPALIPGNAANRDELTSNYQGVISWPGSFRDAGIRDWTTEQISTGDTRWRGSNFGAYSNPQLDGLFGRFQEALEIPQQEQILADALKIANDDLPVIPLYIYTASVMFRTGITGPAKVSPNQLASSWNVQTWDVQ